MKILFYAINGVGLGHLNRCLVLADIIKKIDFSIDIQFITNSKFTKLITKKGYLFHVIENYSYIEDKEFSKKEKSFTKRFEEVLDLFKPDLVVYDTYVFKPIINLCYNKQIKNILLLRMFTCEKMLDLFDSKEIDYLDKIIICHDKKEFVDNKKYDKILRILEKNNKFSFEGYIVKKKNKKKVDIIRKKYNIKEDDFVIIFSYGGGGKSIKNESPNEYISKVSDALFNIEKKFKNIKIIILKGPFLKEIKIKNKTYDFEENILELLSLSNLNISTAGYNTCNDIISTKIPSLLIPLDRRLESQHDRVDYLEKFECVKNIRYFNEKEIEEEVIKLYENQNRLKVMKENFNKIDFLIGNKNIANEIIKTDYNMERKNIQTSVNYSNNNKILFYIEAKKSLGHLNRSIEIAKEILNLDNDIKVKFILDSEFTDMINQKEIEIIPINPGRDYGSIGGNLNRFNQDIKKIIELENPQILVFDTFFSENILSDKKLKKIRKILILRKYRNEQMNIFFEKKYYEKFDKIITVEDKKKFIKFEKKYPKIFDNIFFSGPIIKKIDNIKLNFDIDENFIITLVCGGGGFDDVKTFLIENIKAFKIVKEKRLNIKLNIITGPFYKEFEEIKKLIEDEKKISVKKYTDNIIQEMINSDLIISQAGYNIINEIILTKTPAIIIPGKRNNDDQEKRAKELYNKGCIRFIEESNYQIIADEIIKLIDNQKLLFELEKNLEKKKIDTGNNIAAKEILSYIELKEKKIKTNYICNNNCVHCNISGNKSQENKSTEDIIEELNDLKKKKIKRLIFPCNFDIRKDFLEIIKHASSNGFYIVLETNARLFSVKKIAEESSKYINEFHIHLNGTKDIHNKITKTKSFNQTIAGLINLSKIFGNKIQINLIINEIMLNDFNIIDIIIKLGIKKIFTIFFINNKENNLENLYEKYQRNNQLIEYIKKNKINIVNKIYHNPFMSDDLDVDINNAELKYQYDPQYIKIYNLDKIALDFSTICQLECFLCPTGNKINRKGIIGEGYLKFKDFKKFIDDNPNIKEIETSNYGEIFLNPELDKIIEYAFNKEIKLYARNGVNLNNITDENIKNLVRYNFKEITISIDGATNKTYKKYRKNGNFDKVIDNIKKINEVKEKKNSEFPKLIWQFIIFDYNMKEIFEAKKIADKLNMDFRVKLDWSKKEKNGYKIEDIYSNKILRKIIKIDKIYNKNFCLQVWNYPRINWNGDLLGCCVNFKIDFGNVFKDGLYNIINRKKYRNFKQKILDEKKSLCCKNCSIKNTKNIKYIKKQIHNKEKKFDFSIIIPTYNRSKYLQVILPSLFNLDYPKDRYEIIIIDDGGNDDTSEMIKKLDPTCEIKYYYWKREHPYKFGTPENRAGPSRNIGIKNAKGEILLFWDSDMIAHKDLLNEHKKIHYENENSLVIGNRIRLENDDILYNKDLNIKDLKKEQDKRLKRYIDKSNNDFNKLKDPWRITVSNNLSIKKKETESFDENFVFWGFEDMELGYRLYEKGLNFIYNKKAKGYHIYHDSETIDDKNKKDLINKSKKIFFSKYLNINILEFF